MNGRNQWRLMLVMVPIVTAALLIGLRRTPTFAAAIELPIYDFLTEKTWPWNTAPHPAIALVTMSDEGFWRGLNDSNLAALLETLSSANPSVIAVDLIRDNPLPPGSEKLEDLVLHPKNGRTSIVMICGLPDVRGKEGFKPPPFLKSEDQIYERVGMAVMPEDSPGRPMIRRGLVAIHGGAILSLSAQAALKHLTFEDPSRLESILERLAGISSLPPNAGGYVGSGVGGNQFLIKPGPDLDQSYPVIAAESLAGMGKEDLVRNFAGKIIFVGTDPVLVQDEKPIVGNPALRGINILAVTTAQLLRELDSGEKPVGWVDDRIEDGMVIAAAVICTLLSFGMSGPLWLRIATVIPGLVAGWLFLGGLMLTRGVWIPVGAPVIATLLAGTATYSLTYLHERRDRKALYALLEQNLSPEVAVTIWEHNESLLMGHGPPPEVIYATALFADLKGYSGTTEAFQKKAQNKEFIDWLNRYLQAVIPLIRAECGFVQQFAGDGIFVIFGFPANQSQEHAIQAVRCARAIANGVVDLNQDALEGTPPYHARVGIYTGDIICGTVGDKSHSSYSFFGSTINKAARLESLNKKDHAVEVEPVRILVSDSTRNAIGALFPITPFSADPLQLDPNLPPERVWKIS